MDVSELVLPAPSQIDVQATLTPDEFDAKFDVPCKPVVFTGLIDCWPGMQDPCLLLRITQGGTLQTYHLARYDKPLKHMYLHLC